ncbi:MULTISPECIES: hypothetical protein [Giesbergeria]|uniref:Uncharacterized protein n=1 Tax=Giesbergeria sinuosa TaxID=80883 RepID=A0ABV9QGA7_9BURK
MERAIEAADAPVTVLGIDIQASADEALPTDRLVDISPLALRMSSPFNAGYWLAAA